MTEGQGKGLPRWDAFIGRSTVLCLLLFAALAYPYRSWIGEDWVPVLGLAAGLELFLISVSYGLLRASLGRPKGSQYNAILGGWAIRSGPTIAALFVLWNWTAYPDTAVTVAFLVFYLVLLFHEVSLVWKM